ncbi:hypothetical protein HPB51_021695 [Rhipicephalus microplus]|uniref:FUN14 domain-containing protein 1 n=1 Tax=Rhipicephalus microplus TaxID=6941 RepID=A0A9J6D745_RHIMP|nr:hypothetical protein HPB51_021695 [Rhipicephalus microplus]
MDLRSGVFRVISNEELVPISFTHKVAQHQGYVKVNWSRLNKDLQQAQNELARRTDGKLPRLLEEAQKFVKDNVFLATGFAGGFLLGVASS